MPAMSDETEQDNTREIVDILVEQVAHLQRRVATLEQQVLAREPDEEVGLP
jgi:hypothetical protein